MKIRSVSLAILFALAAVAFAGPSTAGAKVPGIKSTSEYRALNHYVNEMKLKRNTPATVAKKTTYRTRLSEKRNAANTKVKLLFNRRILVISKKDDKRQRRVIRRIRSGQKQDVADLKARLAGKITVLNAREAAAVDRARAPFSAAIQKFANKRAILKKRLARTTKPAKRIRIQKKLASIQKKINTLAAQSQDAANAVANRYNARIVAVDNLYNTKIANVKARAAKAIQQARAAYKRLFKDQIDTAKEIRSNEFQLVTSLRDRGAGYIDQMPVVP